MLLSFLFIILFQHFDRLLKIEYLWCKQMNKDQKGFVYQSSALLQEGWVVSIKL